MLAITRAQSGKRIAYHHRDAMGAMVESKFPAAGKSGNKAERRKKIKKIS